MKERVKISQGIIPYIDDTMYYMLYDLRDDVSISGIHLPSSDEEGPVLLHINRWDYEDVTSELNEMNENEGSLWATSILRRPKNTLNISDLVVGETYILVAHTALLRKDPDAFSERVVRMRKWITN